MSLTNIACDEESAQGLQPSASHCNLSKACPQLQKPRCQRRTLGAKAKVLFSRVKKYLLAQVRTSSKIYGMEASEGTAISPRKLTGKWLEGYTLDRHSISILESVTVQAAVSYSTQNGLGWGS